MLALRPGRVGALRKLPKHSGSLTPLASQSHYSSRIIRRMVGRSNGLHDDSDVELSTRTADDGMSAAQSRLLQGNAYLLIVSVLWGSYTPALRALFTLPGAPAPIAVAAGRGILQATLLGLAVAFTAGRTSSSRPEPTADAKARPGSLSLLIQGSCEIGVYNTIGTLLQTWGLSMTTATRGAFLVQSTAIFTPLLAAGLGMPPSRWLWVSSLIALVATLLVTLDQVDTGGSGLAALADSVTLGDLVTLGAALAYSLATVRLPSYASRVPPLQLALGKSTVLALVASSSLAFEALSLAQSGGGGVSASAASLWPGCCTQPTAWAILAWSAVGPGALSAYLHVKGQGMVGPTDAQIVFATVPLWSAVLAAAFLPGESPGLLTLVGGGGMLLAGVVGAFGQQQQQQQQQVGKSE